MRHAVTSIGFVLLLTVACQSPETNPDYEITVVAFPEGDHIAGREAFLDMGCASCHRVEWDGQLPVPGLASRGPELSVRLAERSSGVVATSVISPSHHVSPEVIEVSEDDTSPMGDFTRTMTVRQLIDIVAYLRSGGHRDAAGLPEPPKTR